MRVIGNDDGTFVFVFEPEEKRLGVAMLKGLVANSPDVQRAIEQSIKEILFAGLTPASKTIN